MVNVKICGLRRKEDILAVNEARPDYIGFVFAPGKRQVSPEQAAGLKQLLQPSIKAVGVFVNASAEEIKSLVQSHTIDMIQLHGGEDGAYIRNLKEQVSAPVIKAVRVSSREDILKGDLLPCDMLLLDAYSPDTLGGSGIQFHWPLIPALRHPFFLAGGLSLTNLEAAAATGAFCLDISSSAETDGTKDPEKIKQLVKSIRRITMSNGKFGKYGGQFIPETLMNAVLELEKAYLSCKQDPAFSKELHELLVSYTGRPSLLYYAQRMTRDLKGAKIYLKREDLNHTGSHKINNALAQVLLAKRMGKTRVIAETGAGQHGVATATAAAIMGMECDIYMGKEDTGRQALNVYRMKLLGASVHPVTNGTQTLKDAVNETLREWTSRVEDTHYVLGSVMGPHPFPTIVRDFQSIIGREVRDQLQKAEGRLPDMLIACVGGGSNAMGLFYDFIGDEEVQLVGCEAAGLGIDTPKNAATISTGTPGVFHGMKSYFCQDSYGQIAPVYSISAGLDYPGIGPEHACLHDLGRARYVPVTDTEAVEAFEYLSRMEGIIPAIESAHAVAYAKKIAPAMAKDRIIVINLSGRGDKDVAAIARYKGVEIYE